MKKIGIITFHNSYNCGSMLESYAIQTYINKSIGDAEIINYSSEGQKELYSVYEENNSIKKIIKNLLIFPHNKKVKLNNKKYEEFKNNNFILSEPVTEKTINDNSYYAVVAGSDQIWNVTIPDYNDVYLLPWVKKAKKVAYSPSFGAKNPIKYYNCITHFIEMLKSFDNLSIREFNGRTWIKDMLQIDVPVLLDPTLLLERSDYDKIEDSTFNISEKYIFFYSPAFNRDICKFVKKISDKYHLKVITWSTKSYYYKFIKQFGFVLPEYESPAVYLNLIKNAELVLTTSYHGTIFSSIYKKKFFTIKNGGMYGDDDRVMTLLEQLDMKDFLITYDFKDSFNYLREPNYSSYDRKIEKLKSQSFKYLKESLQGQ